MSPRSDVLLRSEQSDGQLAVIDNWMPAGAAGPPLHVHDFDEAFYIVSGELTFQIDHELVTRGAGELVFARGGVVHTLANVSEADAHMLIVCTPAGFERHFDESNELPVPPVRHIGPRIPDSGLLPAPPATPAAQPAPR